MTIQEKFMKLTIFGSTGGTGNLLVQKALQRGHAVVAYARNPSKLEIQHDQLSVVTGDIQDKDRVADAIEGADGVINVIGPTPNSPDDLMEIAAKNIVSGMRTHGVERLIWSTGAGIRASQDDPTLMHKAFGFLLKLISPKVLENSKKGVEVIQNSDLKWTFARAPMLTDEVQTGNYYVGYVGSELGRALSRENYANFMLDLVEGDDWVNEMPAASDK
jgi:putative NADH-flavin reductase